MFSSFDDVFPNRVPLSELATNKWILDLQKISNLSIEKIQGTNERVKVTHTEQLNLALNADFGKYWTQDASKLRIQIDNEKLQFWIHENDRFYEPEIRSQGRRWHLAFYIRVSARARDDTTNVVLIDEPGLYLHANAQRDILMNLEEASTRMQVVFSTHSPYLMEQDKFDRIRLVQKSESHGTKVENKVHAVSDVETLTPVLTAIGLELNRGIVATDRLNNVIVEGPSDFYYLTAMKKLLKREINFVFGGGAPNMPRVGTILHGWGCRVIYLYDNDTGYKNAKRSIEKNWPTIDESSIDVLPTGDAIEDLFTKQDFAGYVLQIEPNAIAGKNSVHMKGSDKVLPSRRFLQLCESNTMPNLSAETIAKWGRVFDSLQSKLLEPKGVA